jgi:hypothetical protein
LIPIDTIERSLKNIPPPSARTTAPTRQQHH